jgi:predicted CXXCH cytochrome family protein
VSIARDWCWRIAIAATAIATAISLAIAQKIPDVRNTKHNLSVTGPGTVKAQSETQVCVFCHTPHGAENLPAPLWNRTQSGATYTPYTSSSLEANAAELASGPGGSSKLCLSCHDGTMAIGNINVLNGQAPATVTMTGTAATGGMPAGAGTDTGFTRNLGINLTNDHPISFTYNAQLAADDGELRVPDGVNVGTRLAGVNPKPKLPLENGQMQCATCHDPHIRETDPTKGSAKFLRGNRFQFAPPVGGTYSASNDIVCLACHEKGGQTWAGSVHANPNVTTQVYSASAAALREFPANIPVWQAACLNCHDTHSAQGTRRLLREGTNSLSSPKSGGSSAIEETCYQCHSNAATSILTSVATVPDIKTDFSLLRHMPINVQPEVHDIGTGPGTQRGKDFVESQTLLGKGAPQNRHAECTDCHNPHRVTKNRLFNGNSAIPDAGGTHVQPGNIASGVLRGTTGVEPIYAGAAFMTNPLSYVFKRGDGGIGASTAAASPWVTREYQICLKCHSDFAYDTPPNLGDSPGGTPSGTNGMIQYTNQAMEFQAPVNHRGEVSTTDSGASAAYSTNNHRSWHPVMDVTGRTNAIRTTNVNSFRVPFGANVGAQTLYCSDCHGSNTTSTTSTVPDGGENGNPWGPHGSTNNFILKGAWSATTGVGGNPAPNALCFKCHNSPSNGGGASGFSRGSENLHGLHQDRVGKLRCTWCHIAVPHGWKNKAFLVNLNDVGPEVGLAPGTQVRNNTTATYSRAPYYLNAVLKIRTFARSGNWSQSNCGSAGAPGNGQSGQNWMADGNENCRNAP